MYVRFIAPGRAIRRGIDHGLFDAAYGLVYDRDTPESLVCAIRHELRWFEQELPVPRHRDFCVRSRKRWLAHGICWFRDDARTMIAHAHGLAALIGDCGVPVSRVATRRPGQILYRDDWQIIAKPDEGTPTRWH